MKAIHLTSFVTSLSDRALNPTTIPDPSPTPEAPLLIRITHAGLNFVDLLYVRGLHQNNRTLVRPPFTPGLEFAGTIERAPSTSRFRRGDAVFGGVGTGAFATLTAAPERAVHRVPAGVAPRDVAGLVATAPVAYGALVRVARVQAGEWVLVHAGAGGLGVMAVQVARAVGARVVATTSGGRKADVARALGAEAVVDYGKDGWEREVMACTGGKGVDVVFDTVGLVEASIRCAAYHARVLVVGFAGRDAGSMERIAANRVLLKSIQLLGYRNGEHGRQLAGETEATWAGVTELLAQGKLKPVIYDDERFDGLESVPRALQALADRRVWGKAVVDVQQPAETPPSSSRL